MVKPFIAAMHNRHLPSPSLIAEIDSLCGKGLDVGGGSGSYSMAFAMAGEHIRLQSLTFLN
jgi:hypothetical protein